MYTLQMVYKHFTHVNKGFYVFTLIFPRTPKIVSAEKLYKNDGTSFEDNWQERVIERYTAIFIHCYSRRVFDDI